MHSQLPFERFARIAHPLPLPSITTIFTHLIPLPPSYLPGQTFAYIACIEDLWIKNALTAIQKGKNIYYAFLIHVEIEVKFIKLVCYFPFFTITHLTASFNPKIPPFTSTNYNSDETIIDDDLEKRKNI